ncbi:hypothetical protein X551_04688 [Methylibium sp. T29]|nr:hypothetical protein X551_04688 [Methylibium sp. T29]
MRGRAESGVDDQCGVRQAFAQRAQRERIQQALARADRRAPGHQQRAAGVEQATAADEIVGAVGKHGEAVAHQLRGRRQQLERIGLQRVLVAHHLELEPGRVVELARHVRQLHGLARGAAAGGVGQQARAGVAQGLADGGDVAVVAGRRERALEAHGDHLRARRTQRALQHRRRRVAGGAEQETAVQAHAAHLPGIVVGHVGWRGDGRGCLGHGEVLVEKRSCGDRWAQPPTMGWNSRISSPSCSTWPARRHGRRTRR